MKIQKVLMTAPAEVPLKMARTKIPTLLKWTESESELEKA